MQQEPRGPNTKIKKIFKEKRQKIKTCAREYPRNRGLADSQPNRGGDGEPKNRIHKLSKS